MLDFIYETKTKPLVDGSDSTLDCSVSKNFILFLLGFEWFGQFRIAQKILEQS